MGAQDTAAGPGQHKPLGLLEEAEPRAPLGCGGIFQLWFVASPNARKLLIYYFF